jgi:hypothetical protein
MNVEFFPASIFAAAPQQTMLGTRQMAIMGTE